jgi:hypothetical protein
MINGVMLSHGKFGPEDEFKAWDVETISHNGFVIGFKNKRTADDFDRYVVKTLNLKDKIQSKIMEPNEFSLFEKLNEIKTNNKPL